jgi:hypothetical protein
MPFTPRPYRLLVLSLLGTLAYAVVRYHVLKGVPWSQLPLYTLNKAVSWTAVILMAVAAVTAARARGPVAEQPAFGQASTLAALHVLMSLSLLGPATYPVLYAGAAPSLNGGLALLAGAVATTLLLGIRRTPAALPVLATLLVAHLVLLGWKGWVRPGAWPGYLVPITLLAMIAALVLLVASARSPGGGRS